MLAGPSQAGGWAEGSPSRTLLSASVDCPPIWVTQWVTPATAPPLSLRRKPPTEVTPQTHALEWGHPTESWPTTGVTTQQPVSRPDVPTVQVRFLAAHYLRLTPESASRFLFKVEVSEMVFYDLIFKDPGILPGWPLGLTLRREWGKTRNEMGTYTLYQTSTVASNPSIENMEFWAGPHESPSNLSRSKSIRVQLGQRFALSFLSPRLLFGSSLLRCCKCWSADSGHNEGTREAKRVCSQSTAGICSPCPGC